MLITLLSPAGILLNMPSEMLVHAGVLSSTQSTPHHARSPVCFSHLSAPTSTVLNVDSDDLVDPGDAAIQVLLALTAENTHDDEKRDWLIDAILTVQPLAEWPPECREKLRETCQFIKGLAQDLRQRGDIHGTGDDAHRGQPTRCQPDEHKSYGDGP